MRKAIVLIVLIGFTTLAASRVAQADVATADDLYTIARNHFTQFTSEGEKAAFNSFFQRVQEGEKVDLTPDLRGVTESTDIPRLLDPLYAGEWGDSRVIKADWIKWLCEDSEASKKVTSRGIEIDEAKISGQVDLSWLKLEFPIRIFKCGFTDDVILDRASLRGLQMQTTCFKGIHGDGLNIDRDLSFADHCLAQSVVWLREATIGGSLNCDSSQFFGSADAAINLQFAKIGATVLFRNGFRAQGGVSLQEAIVGAAVQCDGGQFINPGGVALALVGAKAGDVSLRNGFHAEGEVSLLRATIDGSVDCEGGRFINPNPGRIALLLEGMKARDVLLRNGFHAEGEVSLLRATIDGSVDCDGGQFINPGGMALVLVGAKAGDISLGNGFHAEGEVSLVGATIDGSVDCDGGLFCTSPGWMAFSLEGAKTGAVYLRHGFHAEGEVRLQSATVSGTLECDGGEFINPRGSHGPMEAPREIALNLQAVKTRTILLRNSFHAEGEVNLLEATIEGSLYCANGQFINPVGAALYATRVNIGGSVILVNLDCEGLTSFQDAQIRDELSIEKIAWDNLDLSDAKAKTLRNIESGWPPQQHLLLHGFTFDELHKDASFEADVQKHWIRLQPSDPFRAQPFEMMARVLRNMGLPDEAVKVMVYKNERSASYIIAEDRRLGNESQAFVDSFWYDWFGKLIGYGYYPWNAFYLSLLVIVAGAVVFKVGYHTAFIVPTGKDAFSKKTYPRFNAFMYSLETFVPLIKLGLEDYWAPNANKDPVLIRFDEFPLLTSGGLFRIYLWLHIIFGWVLTSLWVAGLTGLLKT